MTYLTAREDKALEGAWGQYRKSFRRMERDRNAHGPSPFANRHGAGVRSNAVRGRPRHAGSTVRHQQPSDPHPRNVRASPGHHPGPRPTPNRGCAAGPFDVLSGCVVPWATPRRVRPAKRRIIARLPGTVRVGTESALLLATPSTMGLCAVLASGLHRRSQAKWRPCYGRQRLSYAHPPHWLPHLPPCSSRSCGDWGVFTVAVPDAEAAKSSNKKPCPECYQCKKKKCKPDWRKDDAACNGNGKCLNGV